jgi:TRAP transporter TAXI family solute receptor
MMGWIAQMSFRRVAMCLVAGLGVEVLAALILLASYATAQTLPARISFQIVTGPTGGTYFPIGQLIAGLVSHPPGVDRCESGSVCGPTGLIISARTSDGAVANVLAVNRGFADSGFAQADVVAQAIAGEGAFRKTGKQSQIRIVSDLFPEDVHLVVARKAKIAKVTDLAGKRVSLGAESSGTSVTVRTILAAYGLPERRMKVRRDSADVDAQLLQQGRLDAFFFVGGRPVALIDDLIARGVARLVPIDGVAREALLKANPSLSADTIPSGTYRGTLATETVSVSALWIVNAREPDALVYGITKSLFSVTNRAAMDEEGGSAALFRLGTATHDLPAPLHPGAERYFREVDRLQKPFIRSGRS